MADIAALALSVDSSQVTQATVALKELPRAATAAERAAERWSASTKEAGRATEDFSRRVRKTIADLEFERAQLARSATERQRYAALRRAGVAEMSAEGQAISASVRALQAQQAAQRKTADETRRSADAAREFASQWRSLLAIGAGTLGARTILQAADAFTALTNSIKVTGAEGTSLAFVQERLFAAANKNGVEIGALGQLYSRTALAGKELGISQERLLEFVDGVTAALRVQGGSTEQASGALLQLSQALGSGTVRAEEFNSILEGALPIAQAAARGMDGMGGSVAKLRAAVTEGRVSSQAFFEATMRGFGETRKLAEGASLTIEQAMTSLSNAFTNYIGQADKASGASAALAKVIASVGSALDEAGKDAASGEGGLFTLPKVIQSTVKEFEAIGSAVVDAERAISDFAARAGAAITDFVDEFNVGGARAVAGFIEAFRALPEALSQLFVNAWEAARVATAKGINSLTAMLPDWLGLGGGTTLDTTPRGTGPVGEVITARIKAAGEAAAAQMRESQERAKLLNRQAAMVADEERARRGGMPASGPLGLGGGTTAASAAGAKAAENAAKKYAELTAELELARSAQDKMTDAARRGEVQFQEQEATLEAQKKLLDIFGKTLDETDPRLRKVRDLILSIAQGKVAEAFNVATTELEKQNVILAKQIELMNEAPEIQAREIALIKAKQEAEKAGTTISAEAVEARRKAIEQNETLKNQQEELKKAQELWTAPLKSALESIQQTAADAFDSMLENGKFSFESLADTFTKILRRMAAEFLALATVRPIMSVIINAIGGQGMAGQFGLSGGGGIGSLFGGGGLGMPSMGGGSLFGSGGFFGGLGDFLNTPFTGPYAGMSPSSMAGVPMLSPSWSNPSTWGITPLQGIGALAGAGMGIFQLMNSRSTASTIGGISSILGAGASLIPGIGPFIGPAIGLLGNLIPGLFGGTKPVITNQTYGQLRYSSGGWFTNGGAWGPNANSMQTEQSLAGLGSSISNVFALLGGVKDPQKVWGLSAQSRSDQGDGWQSDSLSSFLVSPSGNQQLWRMNEDNMWDTGSAQVAWRSIVEGAVGDITENMRKALIEVGQTMGGTSLQAIAETVAQVKAFDDAIAGLGKTTSGVEQALAQIDAQFAGLYDVAAKFGFAVEQIDTAKLAARLEFATNFADSIQRSINDLTDPKINALADLDKWRAEAIKTNADILENVTGSLDQINKIEELYGLQRAQILKDSTDQLLDAQKQAAQQQIATLQDLIRSLTPGGALANVDPRTQLAGLEATYNATRAQAFAGDAAARDRFASDASAYAQFAKSFYGGSTAYNSIRNQIIGDASNLQLAIGGMPGMTTAAANANAMVTGQIQQLMAVVDAQAKQITQLMAELSRTNALLQRFVANEKSVPAAA